MPFDGTNFHDSPPPSSGPQMPSDKVLSRFILFLAIVLIITPFSLFGLVDLVHSLVGK